MELYGNPLYIDLLPIRLQEYLQILSRTLLSYRSAPGEFSNLITEQVHDFVIIFFSSTHRISPRVQAVLIAMVTPWQASKNLYSIDTNTAVYPHLKQKGLVSIWCKPLLVVYNLSNWRITTGGVWWACNGIFITPLAVSQPACMGSAEPRGIFIFRTFPPFLWMTPQILKKLRRPFRTISYKPQISQKLRFQIALFFGRF